MLIAVYHLPEEIIELNGTSLEISSSGATSRKIIFSQWHQNKQNQVHEDLDKDLVATDSSVNEEGH
jgi:hypothetical protein